MENNLSNINITSNNNTYKENNSTMSEKELMEALNVPPYDEKNFPLPSTEEQKKAAVFMYTINSLASSIDKNLQSLIWNIYINMYDFMIKDRENSAFELAMTLEKTKEYLRITKNPILFTDNSSKPS